MKEELRKLNVFEKIKALNKLITSTLGFIKMENLIPMLNHISFYHYNQREKISKKEMLLYDLFLRNGLNPATVYEWFRLHDVDDELRAMLYNKEISIHKAIKENAKRKLETEQSLGEDIRNDILKFIGGLDYDEKKKKILSEEVTECFY